MGYPENPIEDDSQVIRPPGNNLIVEDAMDVTNDSEDENIYNGYQPLGSLDDDNTSDMDRLATNEQDDDEDENDDFIVS